MFTLHQYKSCDSQHKFHTILCLFVNTSLSSCSHYSHNLLKLWTLMVCHLELLLLLRIVLYSYFIWICLKVCAGYIYNNAFFISTRYFKKWFACWQFKSYWGKVNVLSYVICGYYENHHYSCAFVCHCDVIILHLLFSSCESTNAPHCRVTTSLHIFL
jgi:hypothetical protein